MDAFEQIAEQKIREALERGEFDALSTAGRPIDLDELSRVPEDLRASYSILKNAGFLPEEMALKKELLRLDDLIAACLDDGELAKLRKTRTSAALRFSILMERRGLTPAHADYAEQLAAKFAPTNRDARR